MSSTEWPTYGILLLGMTVLTSPIWITKVAPHGFYFLFLTPIAAFVGGAYLATGLGNLADDFLNISLNRNKSIILLYLAIILASIFISGARIETILETPLYPVYFILLFYFVGCFSNSKGVQTGFVFGVAFYLISGLVFFVGSSSVLVTAFLLLILTVFGIPLLVYGLSTSSDTQRNGTAT